MGTNLADFQLDGNKLLRLPKLITCGNLEQYMEHPSYEYKN